MAARAAAFAVSSVVAAALLFLAAAPTGVSAGDKYGHGKIVSCYWSYWGFYRPGDGKHDVDDIDPGLCTHGFYGFADLKNGSDPRLGNDWTIQPFDPWFDLDEFDCLAGECKYDGYRRFTSLDWVSMLSIGGWNAGSGEFSIMAADPAKRSIFINSLIPFLDGFGFDGFDLDWEYPSYREGSAPEDNANFLALSQELAAALKPKGYIFSAAIPAGFDKIEVGYGDVPALTQYYDFFNLMTYDFHGFYPGRPFTGHNAPLRLRDHENKEGHPGYQYSTVDGTKQWTDRGLPIEKMVIGIPLYGRGFQLEDPEVAGVYCPIVDGCPMGSYTRQKGILGYQEILQLFYNQTYDYYPFVEGVGQQYWTRVFDSCYQAPFIHNGPYWISYDDEESVAKKAEYINFVGAAGAVIWSIETDDFDGANSDRPYPLLDTVNQVLASGQTFDPSTLDSLCGDVLTGPGLADFCFIGGNVGETACRKHGEALPWPGDCHRYYRCVDADGDAEFEDVIELSCDDKVWAPAEKECIDPELGTAQELCENQDF